MTIRLQEFGSKESGYERPNQKWVCGWTAEGNPCRLGPDGKGRCPAAAQGLCEPRREGDRWRCTRSEVFGGPCAHGPLPDGSCSRPEPEQRVCQPRLSLRARRGRFSAVCCVLAVGTLTVLITSPGGPAFMSPGPLTSAHGVVESGSGGGEHAWLSKMPCATGGDYCLCCHERGATGGGLVRPVTDRACLQCHFAQAHHATRPGGASASTPASGCTDCHFEHHGREAALTRVTDAACTRCHRDLAGAPAGAPHDVEIAADAPLPAVVPELPSVVVNVIGSFAGDHPEFAALLEDRFDATKLRFEHHAHLNPAKMTERVSAWAETLHERGVPAAELPREVFDDGSMVPTCQACHQLDAAGRFMLPVRFDHHCAHCHGDDLGTIDFGDAEERVPHGSAIHAFASMRARVPPPPHDDGEQADSKKKSDGPGPRRAGPGSAKPARPAKPPSFKRKIGPRCAKCHGPGSDPLAIADPRIPTRWFVRSVFSHEAHRFLDCTDCHAAASPKTDTGSTVNATAVPAELKFTGRTKDVMLPSVESCRECHAPHPVHGATAVRDDCVLCHVYHAPSRTFVAGSLSPPPRAAAGRPGG